MRFRSLKSFQRDYAALAPEHQKMFEVVLREHFLPAIKVGAFAGQPQWPLRLRIHRLSGTSLYSITWSFSGPDGRATFHLEKAVDGAPVLVWRRIGDHSIYDRP